MDSRPYSSLKLQRILVCHCDNDFLEDCIFPDSCSLLNVTNRRKPPIKKKNSVVNNESIDMFSVMQQKNELFDMQTEYDDLLVEYKIQRIRKDIEVDCLTKKLTATGQNSDMTNATPFTRQLKSPIQQNLDDVIELATENNISAVGKYEELHQEFQNAHKENSLPLKEPPLKACNEKIEVYKEDIDPAMELLAALQDMELEVQSSRTSLFPDNTRTCCRCKGLKLRMSYPSSVKFMEYTVYRVDGVFKFTLSGIRWISDAGR